MNGFIFARLCMKHGKCKECGSLNTTPTLENEIVTIECLDCNSKFKCDENGKEVK